MSGAEIVALVSVVVTGLAAPWIAGRTTRRQAYLQTQHAREDELRSVLDAAGIRLTEAIAVVGRVGSDLSTLDSAKVDEVFAEIEQLWKNDDRIRVRLGPDAPESLHYRRALEKGIIAANSVFLQGLTSGFAPESFKAWYDAQQVAIAWQAAFYDAASRRIGPGGLAKPPLLGVRVVRRPPEG